MVLLNWMTCLSNILSQNWNEKSDVALGYSNHQADFKEKNDIKSETWKGI